MTYQHLDINIRPMGPNETGFVMSSWKKSYRMAHPWVPENFGPYYHWISGHVDRLVDKGDILMAVDPDDDDLLLGWICYEAPSTVHYCYVKRPFRNAHVAMRLIGASGVKPPLVFTHWTSFAEHLQESAEAHVKYKPSKLERTAAK